MNHQTLLILGAGGHGIEPLVDITHKYRTHIVYIPGDWGGSTGMLGRLFEWNDYEFYHTHQSIYQLNSKFFLPSGDINKLIMAYLNDRVWNYKGVCILDYRTDNKENLFQAAQYLSSLVDDIDFSSFSLAVFDYYQRVKKDLNYDKAFSIGNLWHHYLISKHGLEGLNEFYQSKDILPVDVFVALSHTARQELIATSIVGHKTIGEDNIDGFPTSLHPSSFELKSTNQETSYNKEIIDHVYNSDLVVIPNGSMANWLPLINANIELMRDISAKGKLVLMGNLFYTSNELPLQNYLEHLYLKDIFPRTLLPKEGWYNELKSVIGDYALEAKIPQSLEAIKQADTYYQNKIPRYKSLVESHKSGLECCLEVEHNTGIKYTFASVSEAIHSCMSKSQSRIRQSLMREHA